jgi:hypothetical protein
MPKCQRHLVPSEGSNQPTLFNCYILMLVCEYDKDADNSDDR